MPSQLGGCDARKREAGAKAMNPAPTAMPTSAGIRAAEPSTTTASANRTIEAGWSNACSTHRGERSDADQELVREAATGACEMRLEGADPAPAVGAHRGPAKARRQVAWKGSWCLDARCLGGSDRPPDGTTCGRYSLNPGRLTLKNTPTTYFLTVLQMPSTTCPAYPKPSGCQDRSVRTRVYVRPWTPNGVGPATEISIPVASARPDP